MATIVTRAGKGSALTFNEADNNFTNLNTDKLENISEDTSPSLGGNLDVGNNNITTSTTNGNIRLVANGSGGVVIEGTGGLNLKNGNLFTDVTNQGITIAANGTGEVVLNSTARFNNPVIAQSTVALNDAVTLNAGFGVGAFGYFTSHAEAIYEAGGGSGVSGTFNPDPANGPIAYVPLVGNITINGFTNGKPGQTITMLMDSATVAGTYTLTLGASILVPGGSASLTGSGYDIITLTLIDDAAPLYVATIVNDFQ